MGEIGDGLEGTNPTLTKTDAIFLHGMVGGLSAAASGGDMKGAVIGSMAGKYITLETKPLMGSIGHVGRFSIATMTGGITAELGGGKFSDGARSAAFGYLFNAMSGGKKLNNPTGKGVRGCDVKGCGNYGAPRVRNGVPGTHVGADYISDPGQDVTAISSGTVDRLITGNYDGLVVSDGNGTSWKISLNWTPSTSHVETKLDTHHKKLKPGLFRMFRLKPWVRLVMV